MGDAVNLDGLAPAVPNSNPTRWLNLQFALLLALLLLEGLVLGIAFDAESLSSYPLGWWSPILRHAGVVMPASATILGAFVLVIWGRREVQAARMRLLPSVPAKQCLLGLAMHAAGFIALVLLTNRLFDPNGDRTRPGVLVLPWLISVVVTLLAWLVAAIPVPSLLELLRAHGSLILTGWVLGLTAFAAGRLAQGLWLPLRFLTFRGAGMVLRTLVPGSFTDPSTMSLGTGAFAVEIAPECSGYEGVGLTAAFMIAAFWLFRARFRFPIAFLLLPLGAVLSWFANVGRVSALVLIGTYLSPDIAEGGFHSYAGSILFSTVALCVIGGSLRSRTFALVSGISQSGTEATKARAAGAYLVPFLAITAVRLVSSAISADGLEPIAALRPLAGVIAIASFWRFYRELSWRASVLSVMAGVGVAGIWTLASRISPVGPHGGVPEGFAALAVAGFTAVFITPLAEELAFRGFLSRRLSKFEFDRVRGQEITWTAMLGSSLVYGLLHSRPITASVAGLCYAYLYRRRGRLGDAIAGHVATNAALLVFAWSTGNWGLWQ
jgi:exosortase E/protease (VPEID-CTERM system)